MRRIDTYGAELRMAKGLALRGWVLTFALASLAYSQMVQPNPLSPLKTKKVVVLEGGNTTGDHAQARDATYSNLQAMAASVGFSLSKMDPKTLTDANLGSVDILVFNYFFETQSNTVFPKSSKDAFWRWLRKGGKGYVGYHTSGANQWPLEWPEYQDSVTNMRYLLHGSGTPQGTVGRTTDPAILAHPIMQGLPATFNAIDEWYEYEDKSKMFDPAFGVKVMYRLTNAAAINRAPTNDHPVAWFREDPLKTRYFYSTFVHDRNGANSDWFKSILLRALEYTAGDPSNPIITMNGNAMHANKGFSYIATSRDLRIEVEGSYNVFIHSSSGEVIWSGKGDRPAVFSPEVFRKSGLYLVRLQYKSQRYSQRVMIY